MKEYVWIGGYWSGGGVTGVQDMGHVVMGYTDTFLDTGYHDKSKHTKTEII